MTPTTENPNPSNTEEIIVKRRLFDLTKFEPVSKEKKINFTPLDSKATIEEILSAVDNDQAMLAKVVSVGLRRNAISEAKAEMGDENLVSPKAVSIFVNQFRPKFPVANDSKDERKAQTQKVFAFIKSKPALLAAIKTVASEMGEDEDGDGDGENETE